LDAWALADILRTDRSLHRKLQPDSVQLQELRALTRDREALVQESVRLQNQLQATLKAYWPEVLDLFPNIRSAWALDFLLRFPTHDKARRASRATLESFLKGHRYPNRAAKAEQIHAALRQPHLTVPDHVVRTRSRQMAHWARQLKTTVSDIKAYDKEIERLLNEHPDGQLFQSLPGAGSNLAARLLAEVGDTRERYATANNLQCEAGTAPIIRQSGKTLQIVTFRRACKKPLRQALQLFAGCSLNNCTWARELYSKHRHLGKRHHEALRIVANKWAKIIFAMWKNNTLYDQERFLGDRARHAAAAA